MHTTRRFFRKMSDAAFRPRTYRDRLKEPMSAGLGYLYWLLVCSFTVGAIVLAAFYLPARIAIRTFMDAGEPQLRNFYPAELVLTLEDGNLSANVRQPYVIDPPFWEMIRENNDDEENGPEHFITINTRAAIDDFADYNTAILVTRTHVVTQDNSQLRAFALADFEKDMVINKEVYDSLVAAAVPVIRMIPAWIDIAVVIFLLLMPFVGAALSWVWHLATLLVWSLLFWLVSTVMSRDLEYGQLYRLGLYGMTLPIILSTFLAFIPGITLVACLVFLVFMIIVMMRMPKMTLVAATPKIAAAPKKKASVSRKKSK